LELKRSNRQPIQDLLKDRVISIDKQNNSRFFRGILDEEPDLLQALKGIDA
jgi:hypothetical protein